MYWKIGQRKLSTQCLREDSLYPKYKHCNLKINTNMHKRFMDAFLMLI